MQGSKNVRFEDVESMMEQMMRVPIFRVSEKRCMLSDAPNNSNDPNLIMDLRHKTIGEPLPVSVTQNAVLAEVTRLLMDEETQALYRKREQEVLEAELKKFEKGLCNTRPRFRGPYTCSKRDIFANIEDYDDLWKSAPRRVNVKVKVNPGKDNAGAVDSQTDQRKEDGLYTGSIKVTIKDKPSSGLKKNDRDLLGMAFRTLAAHAREERRLRDLKIKIQENVASRRLRKYFETWRTRMENSKLLATKRKEEREMSDERKIELFVNAINEKQKKIAKFQRPVARESITRGRATQQVSDGTGASCESRKSSATRTIHVVEPPAQNRLNAQKKIIAEQRAKLEEQKRIIEELRLKRIEDETRKAGRETINSAKEALACCGHRTRRSLIHLMREEGCRDKTLLEPPRTHSPPRFLTRMEARAEARRERVRRAEEERKRKAEEKKIMEETARREEEENRKRLQLEAQREAKRIREEQERRRAREIEKSKAANELAEKFYRKYLLRRYIIEPLVLLVELKHNHMKTATDHYNVYLQRKAFEAWRTETNNKRAIKMELSIGVWRRNVLWYAFRNLREAAKSASEQRQVAADFYELRLQERCLKTWCKLTVEAKVRELENVQLADSYAEKKLKIVYFYKWKKYVKIADEVKESDRRRDEWRELVQRVVPDFDPKQRGVMIDD